MFSFLSSVHTRVEKTHQLLSSACVFHASIEILHFFCIDTCSLRRFQAGYCCHQRPKWHIFPIASDEYHVEQPGTRQALDFRAQDKNLHICLVPTSYFVKSSYETPIFLEETILAKEMTVYTL